MIHDLCAAAFWSISLRLLSPPPPPSKGLQCSIRAPTVVPPLQLIIATSNFWRADVNYLVYKRPCFSKLPPGPSAREREREGLYVWPSLPLAAWRSTKNAQTLHTYTSTACCSPSQSRDFSPPPLLLRSFHNVSRENWKRAVANDNQLIPGTVAFLPNYFIVYTKRKKLNKQSIPLSQQQP